MVFWAVTHAAWYLLLCSTSQSEECAERLHKCPFCELEVAWKELQDHSLVCGSRTELCRDCGRYVQLRDQPDHSSACSAPDSNQGPPPTAGGGHNTSTLSSAHLHRPSSLFNPSCVFLDRTTCELQHMFGLISSWGVCQTPGILEIFLWSLIKLTMGGVTEKQLKNN